jgi:hypothetical protein
VLRSLPPQLTAFTCIISRQAAPFYGDAAAASSTIPPLRKLHVVGADLALEVLPLSRLTGLTSLVLQNVTLSSAQQADISRLTQLVELQSPVWPSMAQQLVGLQGLQKLTLGSWFSTGVLTQQDVGQWGALTQLRELTMFGGNVRGERRQQERRVALQLMNTLPHCIVRLT